MSDKKKALGQFFTEPRIAGHMAELVLSDSTVTVLDPAVGPGVLLQSVEEKKKNPLEYTAFEIDEKMVEMFREQNRFDVDLHKRDYLTAKVPQKFDAIICNPPYNKFQEIPDRKKYIQAFRRNYGIKMSAYSNLCVYFLIKSLNELKPDGKCAYILPYEFLNSGYGVVIKDYLLKDRRIHSIFKFHNATSLFSDAITTSCILYFDGTPHDKVNFNLLDSAEELSNKRYRNTSSYSFDELDPSEKWNMYFAKKRMPYTNLVPFKEIARVSRGIATGKNSFFCLSAEQLKEYGISSSALVRCIAKSADVKSLIFTEEEFSKLEKEDKKVYLFDGRGAQTQADFDYIKRGEKLKVHKGYLNSHRNPWHSVEKKAVAPIWVSVFNRNKLKVIRNETGAKNLTTFHCVFLHKSDEDLANVFFCYLLTPIGQTILFLNKREYGEGLDKFEPNDLNEAMVLDVSKISPDDFRDVLCWYGKIKEGWPTEEILEHFNQVFSKYIY